MRQVCHGGTIFAIKMSDALVSTNLSAEEWRADDPKVGVEGVHTMVLGGWPMWPLVLHQLVTASAGILGTALGMGGLYCLLLELWLAGAQFLQDVREGRNVDWANHCITPDQANCVLAALGLLL